MRKLLSTYIIFMAMVGQTVAQEQLSQSQRADQLYERYEYAKALELYLPIANNRTAGLRVAERVADCYRQINKYDEAEAWYARVTADHKASNISHYYYAEVLLRNQKFDLAKGQYQIYYPRVGDLGRLKQKLASCDSAAIWMQGIPHFKVTSEQELNSPYSDWGLTYAGGNRFLFSSDRDADEMDNRTGNGWYKLFSADANRGVIQELVKLRQWNNLYNNHHIGPIAFYKDTAYITMSVDAEEKQIKLDKQTKQRLYTRRLQLVIAVIKNNKWLIDSAFKYNNLNKYSTSNAALSPDGRLLYFVSDMPGGYGKTDIWFCRKQPTGAWSQPVNCGADINTAEEESFPFVSANGYLYYASKGLPGMGGYDIYKAEGAGANWSTPMNLKYPINSTSDDFALITKDGITGYLSSNRQGGQGSDDIYSFSSVERSTPTATKPPADKTPIGLAKAPKAGQTFVLHNIYYDLDKANIRPDAALELDKVVLVLKEHPRLIIEIASHTDSRAGYAYNMNLSQRRAEAAVAYLVNKGINAKRLVAKGYGETRLLNQCTKGVSCTEAEHQLNRRTEIRIISE